MALRGKQIITYINTDTQEVRNFDSLLYACEAIGKPYRTVIRHINNTGTYHFDGQYITRTTIEGRIKDYSGNSANFGSKKMTFRPE